MIFLNSKMKYFYENKTDLKISDHLSELIDNGVVIDQGYFLFKYFHKVKETIDKKWVEEIYTDATGFECAINSFHLEDYYNKCFVNFEQVANIGFKLMIEFDEYWIKIFEEPCVAILTLPLNTEFSPDAVFRFHKKRKNQFWIDPEEIEHYSEAVMIMEIGA